MKRLSNVLEVLYSSGELVWGFTYKRVERVPKSSLTNELERGAAHPGEHLDFHRLRSGTYGSSNGVLKLFRARYQPIIPLRHSITYPVPYLVENRDHAPHMRDREDGVKLLPLSLMVLTRRSEKSSPEGQQVPPTKGITVGYQEWIGEKGRRT